MLFKAINYGSWCIPSCCVYYFQAFEVWKERLELPPPIPCAVEVIIVQNYSSKGYCHKNLLVVSQVLSILDPLVKIPQHRFRENLRNTQFHCELYSDQFLIRQLVSLGVCGSKTRDVLLASASGVAYAVKKVLSPHPSANSYADAFRELSSRQRLSMGPAVPRSAGAASDIRVNLPKGMTSLGSADVVGTSSVSSLGHADHMQQPQQEHQWQEHPTGHQQKRLGQGCSDQSPVQPPNPAIGTSFIPSVLGNSPLPMQGFPLQAVSMQPLNQQGRTPSTQRWQPSSSSSGLAGLAQPGWLPNSQELLLPLQDQHTSLQSVGQPNIWPLHSYNPVHPSFSLTAPWQQPQLQPQLPQEQVLPSPPLPQQWHMQGTAQQVLHPSQHQDQQAPWWPPSHLPPIQLQPPQPQQPLMHQTQQLPLQPPQLFQEPPQLQVQPQSQLLQQPQHQQQRQQNPPLQHDQLQPLEIGTPSSSSVGRIHFFPPDPFPSTLKRVALTADENNPRLRFGIEDKRVKIPHEIPLAHEKEAFRTWSTVPFESKRPSTMSALTAESFRSAYGLVSRYIGYCSWKMKVPPSSLSLLLFSNQVSRV